MLPPKESLTICFAHVAYRLQERFLARQTGIASFEVRSAEDLARRIGEADVLAVSGLWRSALLESAHRLRFIQSVSAGIDQFDRPSWPHGASGWRAPRASTNAPSPSMPWP